MLLAQDRLAGDSREENEEVANRTPTPDPPSRGVCAHENRHLPHHEPSRGEPLA